MKFKLNMSLRLLTILVFLAVNIAKGQQDPMYTQYNFNTQTFNPAYAGTWKSLGFLVLGRHQWVGMDGAPTTYTFSMQTNTKNEKVGLGLNFVSDKIGMEKRLSLFGDYSYGVQINEKSILRLGLKFGVSNYQNILSEYIQYPGQPDPTLIGDTDSRYLPNFGVGAFLLSDNYYIGFSIPKILDNEIEDNYNNLTPAEFRHYFLITGFVFNLSEFVKFKPTFLTKVTTGAPIEFDITASFLLSKKIWLGAMYRPGDSYGFIAQWIFEEKLRIGYSIDFATSNLKNFQNGTHEVMVSYEIGKQRRWSDPRMF
jgi:type IX secretion system PorP/SprF family membrane protein